MVVFQSAIHHGFSPSKKPHQQKHLLNCWPREGFTSEPKPYEVGHWDRCTWCEITPTMGTQNLLFYGLFHLYIGGLKPSFFHGLLGSKGYRVKKNNWNILKPIYSNGHLWGWNNIHQIFMIFPEVFNNSKWTSLMDPEVSIKSTTVSSSTQNIMANQPTHP